MKLMRKSLKKKRKGFTLMEIMVVVLILGLIAGYAIPRYLSGIRTAKLGQVIANYETARTETWAAYYVPSSTETTTAQTVVKKYALAGEAKLTNPFSATREAVVIQDAADPTYKYWDGDSWETYNTDTLAGGEVVLDYSTSDQITVTAYDDTATAGGMQTDTINDPKL